MTKFCGPAVPVGSSLTVTGIVVNTGDVTLNNVVVYNNQPAPGTLVFGPATLAPGASATFTASYIAPTPATGAACASINRRTSEMRRNRSQKARLPIRKARTSPSSPLPVGACRAGFRSRDARAEAPLGAHVRKSMASALVRRYAPAT